jgi:HSP20 family protein
MTPDRSGAATLRQAMSELMDESVVRQATPRESGAGLLLADVIETPDAFLVRVDVPGVRPDDLSITLFQGTLTIQCPARQEPAEGRHLVHERNHSPLMRQFAFGGGVTGEVSADCRDGVLSLRLEKAETLKPKEIKITAS